MFRKKAKHLIYEPKPIQTDGGRIKHIQSANRDGKGRRIRYYIEYLARRMNIPHYRAYEILVKLADRGFVTRRASSDWSKSLSPKFEILLNRKSKIKNITEKVSEVISELL